jgi:hypothetical protein
MREKGNRLSFHLQDQVAYGFLQERAGKCMHPGKKERKYGEAKFHLWPLDQSEDKKKYTKNCFDQLESRIINYQCCRALF